MKFSDPCIKGILIKRYKRFLADIEHHNHSTYSEYQGNDWMLYIGFPSLVATLRRVVQTGIEVMAYISEVSTVEIKLVQSIPVSIEN